MGADIEGFSIRLKELIGGESVLSFARKCEIPESSLRNYLNGRVPGIDIAAKISSSTGSSLEWLISGQGEKTRRDQDDNVIFTSFSSKNRGGDPSPPQATVGNAVFTDDTKQDLVVIPAYEEVRPSAGAGSLATSQFPTNFVAFDRRWLRDIGVNPVFASILVAEGDSMYPTIPNGSPMVVDTSKTEIRHGCIYVFDLDGDLMVKRIERLPDGTIDLISDNKDRYPTRNVPRDRLDRMNVIGRVFSAVRTF
jgi:phage repressor protein C with HTH and peptisase S24 domain